MDSRKRQRRAAIAGEEEVKREALALLRERGHSASCSERAVYSRGGCTCSTSTEAPLIPTALEAL